MRHFASPAFWNCYRELSKQAQEIADQKFALMKSSPLHPSLHTKKVGKYWSVRVSLKYRALAVEVDHDLLWFWIGSHADYDQLLKGK